MSTVKLIEDAERNVRVKAVFDDIRATRKSDFINNLWLYLAFDPALLEETWQGVKSVMAVPSALDPLTKELVYIAVSITNDGAVSMLAPGARQRVFFQAAHATLLPAGRVAERGSDKT